jgi:2,4-dienoyl-CoA reductase-like NADH-dependent reductase (Old Yellow Enzyme family)
LLSTFELGGLTLSNRVVMAPLTRARAGRERVPNDLMAEYYTQRASAGLIITEATVISEQGCGWVDSPGIYNDAQEAGWGKIAVALHARGTPVYLQLWHCGRASHSSFHGGKPAVSASAIKINGDYIHTPQGKLPHETPRELEMAEVAAVVQDYRRAAERAKAAGFDGVEIHAANGYLIDQFLQSKTNHRTDRYGGTVENRVRFLKEIVEAILTVWPARRMGVESPGRYEGLVGSGCEGLHRFPVSRAGLKWHWIGPTLPSYDWLNQPLRTGSPPQCSVAPPGSEGEFDCRSGCALPHRVGKLHCLNTLKRRAAETR